MHICRVEAKGKQYQIYGEEGYLFSLYRQEVKRYHIEEGCELEDALVEEIYQTVIYTRVKERALYLLERRPYSVAELSAKLKQNRYPEPIIEQVITFLKRYHYLDDMEFANLYVNSYASKRSRKQMTYDLMHKGISKDMIEECMNGQTESELACFQAKFERYIRGKDLQDYAVKQKVFRYFYAKGFPSNMIEEALCRRLDG